jgi:hypothetical protein
VKPTKIDLNDPFEKTLAGALALPHGCDARGAERETVTQALRYLYIAAHGRILQTSIGPITIAPATDPSLKHPPLSLDTRSDLLAVAEQRTAFAPRAIRNGNSSHAGPHSAFFEFLAGRLGSPDSWVPPSSRNGKTDSHAQSLSGINNLTHDP